MCQQCVFTFFFYLTCSQRSASVMWTLGTVPAAIR